MMARASAVAGILLSLAATAAHAEPGAATCRRLTEEARAEAVILYAPRLVLEGARAPSVAEAADPAGPTEGWQARASLAWSVTDALRGRAIERVADAECVRTAAADRAGELLTVGTRYGELTSTLAEIAFREAKLAEVDALIADALSRFEAQRATAQEVDELRDRRAAMRVRIADLRHTAGLLEALDHGGSEVVSLTGLAADVTAAELEVDRRRAALRSVSAWHIGARGGVAGGESSDWFAVVEVSYSFGQPWQAGANRRALQARADELAGVAHQVPAELEQMLRTMRRSVVDLDAELRTIDDELAILQAEQDRVAAVENDAARQLSARYTLERIELEARRTGVAALADARRELAGASR